MDTELSQHPLFVMDRQQRMESAARQALEAENFRLGAALKERFRPEIIVGGSPAMRNVGVRIRQAAQTSAAVLIRGELATAKELVAAAIHYNSSRAGGPLVKVHCAASHTGSLESELFGQENGALPGPLCGRTGWIDEAEGGTIFLDEIADLSLSIQVGLLRFLQEREFERVGGDRTLRRRSRRRRHCPQPGSLRRGGDVSPGLVLPHQRLSHRPAANVADAGRFRDRLAGVVDRPGPALGKGHARRRLEGNAGQRGGGGPAIGDYPADDPLQAEEAGHRQPRVL